MKGDDRRAAIARYKERKAPAGVYAVRCAASGETWVGRTPDLDAIQNRLWFSLRMGSSTAGSLQAAWRAHGEDAFSLDVLERIDEESLAYLRDTRLKERVAHWRTLLSASVV